MKGILAILPLTFVCVAGMFWLEQPLIGAMIAATWLAGLIWEVPIRRSR